MRALRLGPSMRARYPRAQSRARGAESRRGAHELALHRTSLETGKSKRAKRLFQLPPAMAPLFGGQRGLAVVCESICSTCSCIREPVDQSRRVKVLVRGLARSLSCLGQ